MEVGAPPGPAKGGLGRPAAAVQGVLLKSRTEADWSGLGQARTHAIGPIDRRRLRRPERRNGPDMRKARI